MTQMTPSSGAASKRNRRKASSARATASSFSISAASTLSSSPAASAEQQVFSAVLPCTAKLDEIRALEPVGIVLSGGPSSVYDQDAPYCDPKVLSLGVPVLGICYGMQWMAHTLGGKVSPADRREYGRAELDIANGSKLFGAACPTN